MPRFELAYGRGVVGIDVPEARLAGVLEARPTPPVSLRRAFDEAWSDPLGIGDPLELFRPGDRVVVLITDHTRATPTRQLFPLIWERMGTRVARENVTLLVATGTHRAPTDAELESMLGGLRREFRVSIHDCDRDTVPIGVSAFGTSLVVNRMVVEADRVLSIGHVGMHYYAGYSGGRKNVLPGVAGRATIEANHARLTDARSAACVYDGNPINEEMVEAARIAGLDLVVDVVLTSDGSVARVVVGAPEAAHAAARAFWDDRFQVPLDEPYDVVVASAGGHPKDIDLYQAYKGQHNAMKAVRDGGLLFLIAACPDGIGHPVFTDWIERGGSPEGVLEIHEREGFRLGGHKAVFHARDRMRATIFLRSELDDATVRRFFMEPSRDVTPILKAAQDRFGPDYRVLVMPHATGTFPVRREV